MHKYTTVLKRRVSIPDHISIQIDGLKTEEDASKFVKSLSPQERKLLFDAIVDGLNQSVASHNLDPEKGLEESVKESWMTQCKAKKVDAALSASLGTLGTGLFVVGTASVALPALLTLIGVPSAATFITSLTASGTKFSAAFNTLRTTYNATATTFHLHNENYTAALKSFLNTIIDVPGLPKDARTFIQGLNVTDLGRSVLSLFGTEDLGSIMNDKKSFIGALAYCVAMHYFSAPDATAPLDHTVISRGRRVDADADADATVCPSTSGLVCQDVTEVKSASETTAGLVRDAAGTASSSIRSEATLLDTRLVSAEDVVDQVFNVSASFNASVTSEFQRTIGAATGTLETAFQSAQPALSRHYTALGDTVSGQLATGATSIQGVVQNRLGATHTSCRFAQTTPAEIAFCQALDAFKDNAVARIGEVNANFVAQKGVLQTQDSGRISALLGATREAMSQLSSDLEDALQAFVDSLPSVRPNFDTLKTETNSLIQAIAGYTDAIDTASATLQGFPAVIESKNGPLCGESLGLAQSKTCLDRELGKAQELKDEADADAKQDFGFFAAGVALLGDTVLDKIMIWFKSVVRSEQETRRKTNPSDEINLMCALVEDLHKNSPDLLNGDRLLQLFSAISFFADKGYQDAGTLKGYLMGYASTNGIDLVSVDASGEGALLMDATREARANSALPVDARVRYMEATPPGAMTSNPAYTVQPLHGTRDEYIDVSGRGSSSGNKGK